MIATEPNTESKPSSWVLGAMRIGDRRIRGAEGMV
jgi:hypothetical protein